MRDDLLATAARLAGGGRLATHLGNAAERTGPGRRHQVETSDRGQLLGPRHFWGSRTGPNPTDRGKNGSKRHFLTDGRGTPLAITHTGANVHDSNKAVELVDSIPPIKRPRGRPRRRPDQLYADRAYDFDNKIRLPLKRRGIRTMIARRNEEHGSGLGVFRWCVEATAGWFMQFRRLRVRYEKRADIHEAFLIIGCILICWNKVVRFC